MSLKNKVCLQQDVYNALLPNSQNGSLDSSTIPVQLYTVASMDCLEVVNNQCFLNPHTVHWEAVHLLKSIHEHVFLEFRCFLHIMYRPVYI